MKKLLLICFVIPLGLMSGCGQNGELEMWDEAEPSVVETVATEDIPSSPADVVPEDEAACPDCEGCSCAEPPCDDVAGDEEVPTPSDANVPGGEDPGTGEEPTDSGGGVQIITIPHWIAEFVPHIPQLPDNPAGTPENGSDPKWPNVCLELDTPAAAWWLTYQLTGGLFVLPDLPLELLDFDVSTTEEITMYDFSLAAPASTEEVVKVTFMRGAPEVEGVTEQYKPDDYAITYKKMPYLDPLLGYLEITGTVQCQGLSIYYTNSEKWDKYHTCGVKGGTLEPLTINFLGENYTAYFGAGRNFKGEQLNPAGTKFAGGSFNLDGKSTGLSVMMPEEVADCLPQEDE